MTCTTCQTVCGNLECYHCVVKGCFRAFSGHARGFVAGQRVGKNVSTFATKRCVDGAGSVDVLHGARFVQTRDFRKMDQKKILARFSFFQCAAGPTQANRVDGLHGRPWSVHK